MNELILFAAIQVMCEALPISSSGHTILAQRLWYRLTNLSPAPFPEFFDHFLHGPTLFIIMLVFFKQWFTPLRLLVKTYCHTESCPEQGRRVVSGSTRHTKLWELFLRITSFVVIADSATALFYFMQHAGLKQLTFVSSGWTLLIGFIITTGLLLSLVVLDRKIFNKKAPALAPTQSPAQPSTLSPTQPTHKILSYSSAVIIGLTQGCALIIPGLSRFASTYVIARWLGITPRRALQFSFLIQFPLIACAFLYNGVYTIIKTPGWHTLFTPHILIILGVATLCSLILFWFSCTMAQWNKLWIFGLYMIIPITMLLVDLLW